MIYRLNGRFEMVDATIQATARDIQDALDANKEQSQGATITRNEFSELAGLAFDDFDTYDVNKDGRINNIDRREAVQDQESIKGLLDQNEGELTRGEFRSLQLDGTFESYNINDDKVINEMDYEMAPIRTEVGVETADDVVAETDEEMSYTSEPRISTLNVSDTPTDLTTTTPLDVANPSTIAPVASRNAYTSEGVTFSNYVRLDRSANSHNTVGTDGAEYIMVVESHGTNTRNQANQGNVAQVHGATFVGCCGSSDKSISLWRIDEPSKTESVVITGNLGSAQAIPINTDKTLSLNGKTVDPSVGDQELLQPRGGQIMVYAEDEGGKSDRDERFGNVMQGKMGAGDDSLYFTDRAFNPKDVPNGNGAVALITVH